MKKLMTTMIAIAALGACKGNEAPTAEANRAAEIERGRYLVTTSGCHDCHTPLAMGPNGPAPDMARALSGHPASLQMPPAPKLPPGPWGVTVSATNTAWAGPWGVSFTANLTPDAETGLGNWTRQNFIDTIRNGRHMGAGRPLLPPMPAPVYANLTDEDLGAIHTYLRTVPAISNKVPAPLPPVVTTTAAAVVPEKE
jgi:mono/diheme cytochrome c family protein